MGKTWELMSAGNLLYTFSENLGEPYPVSPEIAARWKKIQKVRRSPPRPFYEGWERFFEGKGVGYGIIGGGTGVLYMRHLERTIPYIFNEPSLWMLVYPLLFTFFGLWFGWNFIPNQLKSKEKAREVIYWAGIERLENDILKDAGFTFNPKIEALPSLEDNGKDVRGLGSEYYFLRNVLDKK